MRYSRGIIPAAMCVLASAMSACSSPLPRYPVLPAEESLRVIAERLDTVRTFSGEAEFVCTDERGKTVRLDGAVAAEAPSKIRVRAWKLGHAVFDMTLADGRLWLIKPEERPAFPASQLVELVGWLGPQYFRTARVVTAETSSRMLVVAAPGPKGSSIACEIDRATLTPRTFFMDGRPRREGSLTLDDYAMINGVAWPLGITTVQPGGEVVVEFRNVEINGELPAGALTPPSRAVLQP